MKKQSLFRSTSLVAMNRIFSSILGFARDMIWARIFAASASFDAFIIAFHLPSFIGYVIAEAGLTQAFVPILSENQMKKKSHEVKQFISHASALLIIALIFTVIFSVIFSPEIVKLFAPGFTELGERQYLTIFLFKIMATGILFTTLASLCSAILNTFGNYGISSSTQIIFNLVVILFSTYLASFFNIPIYAVAWGVLLSGILQLIFQLPFLHKKNILIAPRLNLKDPDIRKLIKLMLPALLGVSVMQTGVLIDFIFSSTLPIGSVTWLYYSSRLMELPINIIGIGIATVVLPHLSRSHATNDQENYNKSLNWAIHFSLFISIPASAGLFLLAEPIIATLFGHGLFNSHDVIMTQRSTQAFAIGIAGFMLAKICASGFYAKQNTTLPVKIAIIALLINVILNFLFIGKLAHAGLALATSLSCLTNAAILFIALVKKKYYHPPSSLLNFACKIITSTFIMTTILYLISPDSHAWLHTSLQWQIEHLLFDIVTALFVYFISMSAFGFRLSMFKGNIEKVAI